MLIYFHGQIVRSEIQMAKKKIDKQKLAGRILAGVLAGMMLLGGCVTLLWQIFA